MKWGLMAEVGSKAKLTLQFRRAPDGGFGARCLVSFGQYSSRRQTKDCPAALNRGTGSFDIPLDATNGTAQRGKNDDFSRSNAFFRRFQHLARRAIFAAAMLAATVVPGTADAAGRGRMVGPGAYDGTWNVMFATTTGNCSSNSVPFNVAGTRAPRREAARSRAASAGPGSLRSTSRSAHRMPAAADGWSELQGRAAGAASSPAIAAAAAGQATRT